MRFTENPRREFIKSMSILSLLIGVDPIDLLSRNNVNVEDDDNFFVEDAKIEYQKFLRQTSNLNKLSDVSEEEAKRQYNGLVKILATSADPKFKSYSEKKK